MNEQKNILLNFKNRWHLLLGIEVIAYALGFSILIYFISSNVWASIICFVVIAILAALFIKPWKPNLEATSSYIDQKLELAEYSSSLMLKPENQLTDLAILQKSRISDKLNAEKIDLTPPNHLSRAGIIATLLILIGILGHQMNLFQSDQGITNPETENSLVTFAPIDSTKTSISIPKLENQSVTIRYPQYTNRPVYSNRNMNIKALEGSRATWQVTFDSEVKQVAMHSQGTDYPMKLNSGTYRGSTILRNSGFYYFRFTDSLDNEYTSELYSIEVTTDRSPEITISGIEQFTSFEFQESKKLQLNTSINDDYGISQAHIIATVSKGSGESVKFREEKMAFDGPIKKGSKNIRLLKTLDLDGLKMDPGDELYFYVESSDFRQPIANTSRSETYFAVIKDTTTYDFAVAGNLGVDRMPDYFRSQRQLIIDTKKLISEREKLTKDTFNFRSNELGYDQKALRLRYAEFMGEEEDSGLDIGNENLESFENEEQNEDEENEDPLAEYTHDHDNENEHNLVDEDEEDEDSKNPLQQFMHNHDDPEEATLFTESLRTKLRNALNEMWDAELYLRLYEPSKSLPYQYRALELIQDIKNSARIYVHRIGFDPPPIKEDKRLTGKLDDIVNYRKSLNLEIEDQYQFIRQALLAIEELMSESAPISQESRMVFEEAGNELAAEAINSPGKFLKALQFLKRISEGKQLSNQSLKEVQKGLFMTLPESETNPYKEDSTMDEINRLLLKELSIHE